MNPTERVRVLYSFPHKLGADRICTTAWQLVSGLITAGADVTVFPGAMHRQLPEGATVQPTLARGRLRIPYKALGRMRALALHDAIVARRLEKLAGSIDIVHTWPLGAEKTLKAAARLGIPTVLERPNANTRYAYRVVEEECQRLGISMPPGHEHAYDEDILNKEEREYALADRLLCPSDFVARTFRDYGFPSEKLARHQYGYDPSVYQPSDEPRPDGRGLSMLFVGGAAPRKGIHFALDAWLRSSAHKTGTFQIAGQFIPGYAEKLASQLAHPSVRVLGHRRDVPELMRQADVLVLPSIEEGSALVTSEARGSGCVVLVSEASGAICEHMVNALVHQVGDVDTLAAQITMLDQDRDLLNRLRAASLKTAGDITWQTAGVRLLGVYEETIRLLSDKRKMVREIAS